MVFVVGQKLIDAMLCNAPGHRFQLLKSFTNIGTKRVTLAIWSTVGFFAGILAQ